MVQVPFIIIFNLGHLSFNLPNRDEALAVGCFVFQNVNNLETFRFRAVNAEEETMD